MKTLLKRILPAPVVTAARAIRALFWDTYWHRSYSQEGEDMILDRLFEGQRMGFYVDVGAHHPKRFSNTYLFYRRGWRGINIDAAPGTMALFDRVRPRDTNLEVGIGDCSGQMTLFVFSDPALNTLDRDLALVRDGRTYRKVAEHRVQVRALREVLADFLPPMSAIDFLSVDVEGFDLAVLSSNDWDSFRPRAVLVESCGCTLDSIDADPVYQFMKAQDYSLTAKTVNTMIFQDPHSSDRQDSADG